MEANDFHRDRTPGKTLQINEMRSISRAAGGLPITAGACSPQINKI
jgi:hypothetical protein